MSLETLLEAARYIELQEIKQKQSTTPPKPIHTPIIPATTTPLTVATAAAPLRIKHDITTINNVNNATTTNNTTTTAAAATAGIAANNTQTFRLQSAPAAHRVINNSFDIINPLIIDEAGEARRKQPPLVFRSGTREVHNKLEKHRRAHLKECFDLLKKQLPPTADEKKASNLNILHSAIKCIKSLKKEERELEHLMERLAREKIAFQQKLAVLKKDVSSLCDVDVSALLPDVIGIEHMGGTTTLIHDELIIKEEAADMDDESLLMKQQQQQSDIHVSIGNVLKLGKGIAGATIPVVTAGPMQTAAALNGTKDSVLPQTTQMQTAALSVLPIGYQMNQGLVLQKVIMPKNISDFTQLVSSPPVAHFIATPQQLDGKVVPIVNAQYVVKPLVVVSTPSRPS